MKFDLSNGEVDEEVDAAVDGQAEVAHPKQPAKECEIFDQNCPIKSILGWSTAKLRKHPQPSSKLVSYNTESQACSGENSHVQCNACAVWNIHLNIEMGHNWFKTG